MADPLGYQLDHIHIYCTDLDTSVRWFVEGLGAEVIARRVVKNTPGVVVHIGGADVLLRGPQPGESPEPSNSPRFGVDHFGLRVDDLDATAAELKRRGVRFALEPTDWRPGMRIAFVSGPDNLRIELTASR